jgi:pantoate--beta-alanine ligase
MLSIERVQDLREQVRDWRRAGLRVGLVPTLGNLHAGHQSLVRHCSRLADRTLASVFVNPTQFGPGEDFNRYPRTLDADRARLIEAGAQALFAPSLHEVYPGGAESATFVDVPGLSEILCGAARPGHFRGVATVVCRLFNMVQPDVAVFGEKDWQQLIVIRRMTRDLAFPVEVVGSAIVRESDGLAMSSRNTYLSAEERARAAALNRVLRNCAEAVANGEKDYPLLERGALSALEDEGFRPDYVAIRDAETLALPTADQQPPNLRILAAAWLGKARLIDNVGIGLS